MSLIQVLHTPLILFMLLVDFTFFGMYFLSDVYPIHTFPSTFFAPKTILGLLSLSYHCTDLALMLEVDVSVTLQKYYQF